MNEISAVIIFSSPHKNGKCADMLSDFLLKLKFSIKAVTFNTYDMAISPCIDCGGCKTTPQCSLRDLDPLYEALESCDLLIIASPVYNMSFPSPMKAVLDRFQRYFNARFSLGMKPAIKKHRKAVLLACAGSEKENGEIMVSQLRQTFSVMNTDLCAFSVSNGLDNGDSQENENRLQLCADTLNNIIASL